MTYHEALGLLLAQAGSGALVKGCRCMATAVHWWLSFTAVVAWAVHRRSEPHAPRPREGQLHVWYRIPLAPRACSCRALRMVG
mgnify:CR=1 FL=1